MARLETPFVRKCTNWMSCCIGRKCSGCSVHESHGLRRGREIPLTFTGAVWRARRNHIQRLRRADETWCSAPSDMELMATSYFKEVFTKDPTLSSESVLENIL